MKNLVFTRRLDNIEKRLADALKQIAGLEKEVANLKEKNKPKVSEDK